MYSIRPMLGEDRSAIIDIVQKTGMFSPAEIEIAVELIDTWLDKPEQKDYIIFSAHKNGQAAGYVCFGPTPGTQGTWDLYWIAVAPSLQGFGIGAQLQSAAEKEIQEKGGRLVVIETSSTEKYLPTRAFYEKKGYTIEARIRDFYRPGDDKLIYVKKLQ